MKSYSLILVALSSVWRTVCASECVREGVVDEAVILDSRLWLRRSGELDLIDTAHHTCTASFDREVVGITKSRLGTVWMAWQHDRTVAVLQWTATEWRSRGDLSLQEGERLLGLSEVQNEPLVLTTGRLIRWNGENRTPNTTLLSEKVEAPTLGRVSLTDSDRLLYVGINAGEWGGRLLTVDVSNGRVLALKRGMPVLDLSRDELDTRCAYVLEGDLRIGGPYFVTHQCGDAASVEIAKADENKREGNTWTRYQGSFDSISGSHGLWIFQSPQTVHHGLRGRWSHLRLPKPSEQFFGVEIYRLPGVSIVRSSSDDVFLLPERERK